jgi:ribosomal protein S18 acetylase RimI-like enzyme
MIRPIGDEDADAYSALRRAALLDTPLAFGASPTDDFVSTSEAVREQLRRAPEWVLLGAFEPDLAGAVGVMRDRHVKASHKAHLWGMYVAPGHRHRGVGAALVRAAIDHARTLPGVSWVHLGVSAAAPAARRLYERAGFEVWGTEPDALRHDGETASERHMALDLRRRA